MKLSEWVAAREAAKRAGAEAVKLFDAERRRGVEAGIARGGPLCCGTTGAWHLPWCSFGPREPEEDR